MNWKDFMDRLKCVLPLVGFPSTFTCQERTSIAVLWKIVASLKSTFGSASSFIFITVSVINLIHETIFDDHIINNDDDKKNANLQSIGS